MTEAAVFACRGAREARWQLGDAAPPDGWTLIGWRQSPRAEDAGVPDVVAGALADAFGALARVTFPCSTVGSDGDAWVSRGSDHVRTMGGGGLGGLVRAALKRAPREIVLVSTRNAETIVRLFDDEGYPWWMQGTFALLSAAAGGPPEVDRTQVAALLDGPGAGDLDLVPATIDAVVRPGVDGDVAGVLSRTPDLAERLLAALAAACERRGIRWTVVSVEDFVTSFT